MALTGDTFDLVQGGVVTQSAQIVDNGATVGDVLTVQADKSIAAAPGGGSQSVRRERLAVAFDTPNIRTGITFFTPAVGEIVFAVGAFVPIAWNGPNTPTLGIGNGVQSAVNVPLVDADTDDLGDGFIFQSNATVSGILPVRFAEADPLVIRVTDANLDPDTSTAGTAVVFAVVLAA